jgi:putative mRNA 3-end processing factor
VDAGFALSDHADWNSLITTIKETGAEKVFVTHGFQSAFSRYLNEKNITISAEVKTQFGDEDEETNSPLEIKNEEAENV